MNGNYEGNVFSVGTDGLQKGLYYVRIQTGTDIYVSKIIIN